MSRRSRDHDSVNPDLFPRLQGFLDVSSFVRCLSVFETVESMFSNRSAYGDAVRDLRDPEGNLAFVRSAPTCIPAASDLRVACQQPALVRTESISVVSGTGEVGKAEVGCADGRASLGAQRRNSAPAAEPRDPT